MVHLTLEIDMLKPLLSIFALLSFLLPLSPAWADEYTNTIDVFKKAGESGTFFEKAHGYAVFPTIGKGAVGVGGAHGDGRVYEKGKYIGDVSMTQLSIGFQLGGEAFSEIIFFENEAALKQFTGGNFEFGAEAKAVAVTASAGAEASTKGSSASASSSKNSAKTSGGYYKGMAPFTVMKGGLMFDVSIGGQKFNYKPR
jgi:lipid-binding SYLF domain-containing protein